ncbi:hypothetical protein MPSI1_002137 [Malassezia psittaci]|uniref:Thioredoxin-like fold domain-containing protein n=1 Tax=Malassezia psittaci TaxID=1821823 RepID=A0AAF0F9Q4_9BASI|nr:hypothetical protein MPSI1_002137 [Malassezia psittaci]
MTPSSEVSPSLERNVSFSPTKDYIESTDRNNSYTQPDSKPKKSAMKPGHQARLPPAERYQHSDPLLRRLRLLDGHGKPVNLKSEFRDAKLILFYFGSQWHADYNKGCSAIVTEICREYARTVKVIYVSVDTDERHYLAATKNRPWLSMEFNDGSSEPSEEELDQTSQENSTPSETFLLADDEDLDADVVAADSAGKSYVCPLSRVYMANMLDVLLTPTLAVYSLEHRKFLDRNVRQSRLRKSRAESTIEHWLKGEVSPSMNWIDALYIVPWTAALAVAALAYLLVSFLTGHRFSISHLLS